MGFYLLSNMYTGKEIRKINALIEPIIQQKEGRLNNVRAILKDNETLFSHVFNTRLKELIRTIHPEAKLVKSIYFDKSGDQNWVVNWHQDIPINVSEKKEIDGFSSWVQKDGFYSVLPPEELSKKIFTLRIHLDDVTVDSGALKVIPLSHKKRLTTEQTTTLLEHVEPVVCQLERGGVMLMRPLLLHASGKNKSKKKRRILHLEFSAEDLPGSLQWAEEMELTL
ncbi:MAG: phytanoyl-CoA dioxygenase family protein [Crocinitomicaceae bacterium]|nr:phytanoyl-CoA dioxygenase family protein [Crocinitomicaceae bacterium]